MRRFLGLLAIVALSACSDSSSPSATIVGTWNLTTVNGTALPFVFQASPKVELLSDQYVISSGGTFTEASSLRFTTGTSVTTQNATDGGSYSINGTTITVKWNSDQSTATGSLSDNTLTLNDGSLTLVYARQ